MKRITFVLATLLTGTAAVAQLQPIRRRILGLGSVSIALPESSGAINFYIKQLGFGGGMPVCEGGSRFCLGPSSNQRIDLITGRGAGRNGLVEETFETSDVEQLHRYLESRGAHPTNVIDVQQSNRHFSLVDPEGHVIGFIQYTPEDRFSLQENQASSRVIHAGFVLRDRAAEDRFYKDILGFHVYWHGGMKNGADDWIDMQVPDGTAWIEYMRNVPAEADKHTLGVVNHIALGVPDIKAAREPLIKNAWKPDEESKIGRDGKWQLNLYDPDGTRFEFMEFTPAQKPCCSEFTGPYPGQSP
jgi:catechol 2,3-dioxygenase-like lactoylglutathione lyase family enzyme